MPGKFLNHARWTAGTTVLVVLHSVLPVHAQDIPWDRIQDTQGISAAQRKVAEEVLRTARCYGECKGTVLGCLLAGDPIGTRLANFIARRAAADRTVENVLSSVTNRRNSAFPSETFDPDLDALVPLGSPDAPVRVVVFADFECSYCSVALRGLREIGLEMPEQVSLWFKNFPLTQDARAIPSALAYLAAERQGLGWEMNEALFRHEGTLSDEALEACAAAAGLDLEQYRADLQSGESMERIRAEKAEGVSFGIRSAPGILVNGKPYSGIKTKVELLDRIEEEFYILTEME
ncbi:MAG TPA: thioredoxin domain-containing protein [Candidatus Krumholzibacteria bacterium]|nr:thioredoxin domain-containing protein [Candidatus Krumholzibacteria bacterium]